MSGSLNKVMLIGNVGADPEVRRTQDGKAIASISLATSETWKDKSSGERRSKSQWHKIVCFNDGLSKVIENYVRKGSKIYVEGQLQTRKWQDNNGNDKWTTEVILQNYNGVLTLLDKNPNSDGGGSGGGYSGGGGGNSSGGGSGGGGGRPGGSDIDDEIPFAPEWRV